MPRTIDTWTPAETALLGTDCDAAIAAQLGRTEDVVYGKRRRLGIPAYTPHARQWTDAELARLGTVSDALLAAELGVARLTVLKKRRVLGIKCCSPRNRPRKFRRRGRYSSTPASNAARRGRGVR